MERMQLVNLYQANGLFDFHLNDIQDLLKVHGIRAKRIKGYSTLDYKNKKLFEDFIINFMNAQGLDSKASLNPVCVYYVEDTDYYAKEEPDPEMNGFIGEEKEGFYIWCRGEVKAIDEFGIKTTLRKYEDDDFKGVKAAKTSIKHYLRFEYKINGRDEWLHVMSPTHWY